MYLRFIQTNRFIYSVRSRFVSSMQIGLSRLEGVGAPFTAIIFLVEKMFWEKCSVEERVQV